MMWNLKRKKRIPVCSISINWFRANRKITKFQKCQNHVELKLKI